MDRPSTATLVSNLLSGGAESEKLAAGDGAATSDASAAMKTVGDSCIVQHSRERSNRQLKFRRDV